MTKAEILKKHKMTEQEFYAKYPTQESYTKEFGGGGTVLNKADQAVYNKWEKNTTQKYPNADKKLLKMFYDKNVTPSLNGQDTIFTENLVHYPGIHGSNGNKMILYKDGGMMKSSYSEGGSIHIKPENRGKFTAYKERTGKTTEEALHSPNAHVRQMANFAKNAAKWKHADGGMMPKTSTRITPEITRLSKGGKLMTYDNGGNLTYDQQIALQNNQAELDAKNTAAQNKYTEGQQKIATNKANNITSANAIAGVLGNSLNPIENSNTGNKQMDYYNNKISKDSKMASTALGLAGAGIGSLIAPGVGTSIGASLGQKAGGLFAKGGNMQVPMNIVNADNKPELTKYSGLKHSEGGIALGNTGNEVEDKETRVGNFIFSEKLKASKNTSFADMSKKIEKQTVGRRDNDSISKETFNRKISNLASVQEASKAVNGMSNKFAKGGKMFEGGGKYDVPLTFNRNGEATNIFPPQVNDDNFYKDENGNLAYNWVNSLPPSENVSNTNPYKNNNYLQPYSSNTKPKFMDIPSSINTNLSNTNKNSSMLNNSTGDFTGSLENKNMMQEDNQSTTSLLQPKAGINTTQQKGSNYTDFKVTPYTGPLANNDILNNPILNSPQVGDIGNISMNTTFMTGKEYRPDPNFVPKSIKFGDIKNPGLGKLPNYSPLNPNGSLSVKNPLKEKAGSKLYYNFNGKEYNPESKYIEPTMNNPITKDKKNLDLSWLNPAAQLGLTALGNYKPLPVKNYQMKPELLDSTQAKRENRDAFSGLNSDLATSGLSGGQYLASRMGSAAQQAGENAKIDNQYRTANVGIKNQFKQMNTATDKEVQELNAREIDASKTARQMRNQNMAGILGGYSQDKARQTSTIPEGHEAITDKMGRLIGFKNKVTGAFTAK